MLEVDNVAVVIINAAPPPIAGPPAPQGHRELENMYEAEAPLRRLLALASVVGLQRQIEREDTVVSPPTPEPVSEGC